MTTALLLSIHAGDIAGIIFSVVYLLVIVIVALLDYGFKHGWFIPTDETVRKFRDKILQQKAPGKV